MKKFITPIKLAGDHIKATNGNIIAKVEAMPGFVSDKVAVHGRNVTARMLVSAYNHVFCNKPLPKTIQKLV